MSILSLQPSWTLWLEHKNGEPAPSYLIVRAALEKALPDFILTFTITSEEGGNPRDGYLHGIEILATHHATEIAGNLGVFSTATPELLMNQARYELSSLTLTITSYLPWDAQRDLWQAIADAFAPLSYVDSTCTSPCFVDKIASLLEAHGEHAALTRLLAEAHAKIRPIVTGTTLNLNFTHYYDVDALIRGVKYPERITDISLAHCHATHLPEELKKFTNVTTLRLQHNTLTSLPAWLSELPHLQHIYLEGNPLPKG